MVSEIVQLWRYKMSLDDIAEKLTDSHGIHISKAAVFKALYAASGRLKSEEQNITKSLSDAPLLKADETTYTMGNSRGYVWTVIGGSSVVIHATPSRAAVVMDMIAPYYSTPITCDGYSGYSEFKTVQRCWAHILRESAQLSDRHGKKTPELTVLHSRLQEQFVRAKELQRDSDDRPTVDTGPMISDTLAVADRYNQQQDITKEAEEFATKLRNAAPNLFTFVNYPGMEPTNNESERMLRPVVIHRKIRYRMVNEVGAAMFSTLMTCVMTWKKRGYNVSDTLHKALSGT